VACDRVGRVSTKAWWPWLYLHQLLVPCRSDGPPSVGPWELVFCLTLQLQSPSSRLIVLEIVRIRGKKVRCRTPVGQMIIFGKDPAGGNKLVS
jgi:hypothetical protein